MITNSRTTRSHRLVIAFCMLTFLIFACSEGTPTSNLISESTNYVVETENSHKGIQDSNQFEVYVPNVRSSDLSEITSRADALSGFDPHVIVETSSSYINNNEMITLVGRPVQIGTPIYSLTIRDEGVQDAPVMVNVTYENLVEQGSGTSRILELVSATADLYQVTFVLRAISPGKTTITIIAIGDVLTTYPEPSIAVGEGSGSILITVGDG